MPRNDGSFAQYIDQYETPVSALQAALTLARAEGRRTSSKILKPRRALKLATRITSMQELGPYETLHHPLKLLQKSLVSYAVQIRLPYTGSHSPPSSVQTCMHEIQLVPTVSKLIEKIMTTLHKIAGYVRLCIGMSCIIVETLDIEIDNGGEDRVMCLLDDIDNFVQDILHSIEAEQMRCATMTPELPIQQRRRHI